MKRTVVLGLIGPILDRSEGADRWQKWRPTVTLCQQEDFVIHRLELLHAVRNETSCRVASRTGFALEGTKRKAVLHPDGWHDMHLHARVRGD